MKLITTSAVALSLLVSAAPFAAFADDSSSTNPEPHDQVQVHIPGTAGFGAGIRAGINGLVGGKGEGQVRVDANMPGDASTTRPEMRRMDHATTTRPMNGGNGAKVRAHGDTEIDARIASLNKMLARIADAARLSPDAKASLTATLNAQIASLTSLKAQIDTEGTTTLKTDTQSITKDFRIYALVMPKAAITAAADRIMTIAGQMETLSGKIATRITAAQTAGADVTAAIAAHTDFDAKVADAKVQAQAAVSLVANLAVDGGDTATFQANVTALKGAKAKIDAAQADFKAARADVNTILTSLKGKGEVKADTSTTANAQ